MSEDRQALVVFDHGRPALQPAEARTIVVGGGQRSGTSMTAGALRLLGVDMGRDVRSGHNSDPAFNTLRAIRGLPSLVRYIKAIVVLRSYVKRRNRESLTWGWKESGPWVITRFVGDLLRNPHYVLVFRNPVGTALARAEREGLDWQECYADYLSICRGLSHAWRRSGARAMAFGYEWAIAHPAEFVDALIKFAGLVPSAEQRAEAIAYIDRAQPYRVIRPQSVVNGAIDVKTPRSLQGWAWRIDREEPVTLALCVAGELVSTTVADGHRPDTMAKGFHPSGYCGFSFEFDKDIVDVRSFSIVEESTGEAVPDIPF